MNFADIENLWRSPRNDPSSLELKNQLMTFSAQLRRRRRGLIVVLSIVFTWLILTTGWLAFALINPGGAAASIAFRREWGALVVLALPWVAVVVLTRQLTRHLRAHAGFERSIPESLRALLDENRLARQRLKLVGVIHGLLLVMLPVVVYQLRAAGKAGNEVLVPAFVVWPLTAWVIGVAMWWHYRRRLLPQKRDYEALLSAYESPND